MYKVILRKQIHGSFASVSSEDVYMVKEVEIPIPPAEGLTISWMPPGKEKSYDVVDAEILDMVVTAGSETVVCYTHDDKELYEAFLKKEPGRPIADIVQEHLDVGWRIDATRSKKAVVDLWKTECVCEGFHHQSRCALSNNT